MNINGLYPFRLPSLPEKELETNICSKANLSEGSEFAGIKNEKRYTSIWNHSHSEQLIEKYGIVNSNLQWVASFQMSFLTCILGMIIEDNMICTLTWIGITLHLSDTACLQNSERFIALRVEATESDLLKLQLLLFACSTFCR